LKSPKIRYWVTPLLREDVFAELQAEERRKCHEGAVKVKLIYRVFSKNKK